MKAKINKRVISYINDNKEQYQNIDIKENDLWHLKRIIQNHGFEKEKQLLELEENSTVLQFPLRLFNLTKDIIPE